MSDNDDDDELERYVGIGLNGSKRRNHDNDSDASSLEMRYGETSQTTNSSAAADGAFANQATFGRFSYNSVAPVMSPQIRFTQPGTLLTLQPSQHVPAPPAPSSPAPSVAPPVVAKPGTTKRKVHALPLELSLFRFASTNRDRLVIGEIDDPKTDTPIRILKTIITGTGPTKKEWDMDKLFLDQIRTLCKTGFDMAGFGSQRKKACLAGIANKIEMGVHYDQLDICKPNTTPQEKKNNSLLRLINACFLEEFRNRVITANNVKKRKNFVESNKRNPDDDLWGDISDVHNDPEENSRIGFLCDSKSQDEDEHLHNLVANNLVNLNDFTQGTGKSCQTNMRNLMKARNNILEAKKISGTHPPDSWYYLNSKHLTVGKNNVMPDWAVYYLDVMCNKFPAINSAYASRLKDSLKSSSAEAPAEEEDEKPSKKDNFLKVIEQATSSMEDNQQQAKHQRAKLIQFQEKVYKIQQRNEE